MPNIEELIDKAIKQSLLGEDISALLSLCPPQKRAEVVFAVQTALKLASIKAKEVPIPTKRKLYADYEPATIMPTRILAFFKSMRVSYAVMAAVAFIAVAGTVQAAMNSLPGSKLFFIKRNIELAQIRLTSNPEKRAEMQLTFALNTVNGAKQAVLQNDSAQAQAALSEASNQTEAALNNVKSIASSEAVKNPAIISNAEQLANESSNLVAKTDPSARQSIQNNMQEIKNIVSAAVNEQDSAKIQSAKIDVSGKIKTTGENTISIDSNVFEITSDTKITDANGNAINLSDLHADQAITLTGHTEDDKNIAESITVLPEEKPAAENPESNDANQQDGTPKASQNNQNAQQAPIPAKPNDTFGGFIPEPAVGF